MTATWASGWATGDIVTAAEFRKGAGSIFDTTLGASAGNVDITGILGSYAHLMVMLYARGDAAASTVVNFLRLNNDSAANYDYQYVRGSAATVVAGESFTQNQLQVGNICGATAGANLFSVTQIFIPHYANTVNNKTFSSYEFMKLGTATGNLELVLLGGGWRSNAAINRLTFFPQSGNFVAGTRVTVYAMGA